MSIIYSYPEQGALNANDMLIGTSAEKVGGKQKNITRNFTVQQIADFINRGAGFVDPVASDFQIPVFNQGGTKITGSIISQNTSPSNGSIGSAITITGSLTVTNGATIGDFINDITLQSPTALIGPIKDANSALSAGNQILLSTPSGNVVWQNYEAGLTYEGTWDASTNTPALTSGQGVSGHFYIVSVAGNTNLDGNNDWHIGDWAVFFDAGGGGTAAWQKIDNTSVLTGNGTANTFAMWTATETLNDSLLSQDVGATKVIVDGLLEVKGDGASQDGRIKLNCSQNSHGVTIQSPPHSAGASYTLVLPTSIGTSGQALTTDGSNPAQLSWTTPTTGTVTGTGTQNYVTKWSAGGTGIENSTIFDNGTNVGIGTASPTRQLTVDGQASSSININSNVTNGVSILAFGDADDDNYAQILLDNSTNKLQIQNGGGGGVSNRGLTLDSSENVGIGTSSPTRPLTVSGGTGTNTPILVNATAKDNAYIAFQDSGTTGELYNRIGSEDNDLIFRANNAERMRIDSSGNVGIGTSTPASLLSVRTAGISGDQDFATFSRGISTEYEVLKISRSAGSANFLAEQNITLSADYNNNHTGANSNIVLKTDNAERMRIISNGNVGIGTTSPAVSLDISATDAVQMPVGLTGNRPVTGVSNGMLRYNSTNNEFEGYINGNWGSIGGGASGGLIFKGTFDASTGAIANGGSLYTCPAGGPGGTVDIAVGDLYIVTTAGSFYCSGTNLNVGDEVICITAATAGNSSASDWNAVASGAGGAVTGSGTTNYIPKFTGATVVGNSSIFNDASGNVGIGTVSPSAALDVAATTGIRINEDGLGTKILSLRSNFAGIAPAINVSTNHPLLIQTNNTERMRIDAAGNVGIGTTSPSAKLDVQQNTTGDLITRIWNTNISGTGNCILRIANNGNNANGNRIEFSDANYYTATISADRSQGIVFRTSATGINPISIPERMRIANDGKVGIGTNQPQVSLDLGNNTDAIIVPNGAQADRPSGILPGMIRYNTSSHEFEGYSGILGVSGSWGALGGGLPTKTVNTFTGSGQSFIDLTVEASSVNYIDMYIDGVYQAKATYTIATPGGTAISRITLVSGTFPTGVSIETVTTT